MSGQHDELDEQFDKPTGWLHAKGCSTTQHGRPTTRAVGTNRSNADTKRTIPGQRSNSIPIVINWLTEKLNLNTFGQNEILTLSKKKNYLHICAYSTVKQKCGNQEWSVKQNKCLYVNLPKQHAGPPRYKMPWTRCFKPDGKKTSGYV